jgi:O-methyltransferase
MANALRLLIPASRLFVPPIFGVLRRRWRDRNRQIPDIPDHNLYRPTFSPWLGDGDFGAIRDEISTFSLVSPDRIWILHGLARNAINLKGDFVECGVYKGGTARLLAHVLATATPTTIKLHLFDSFSGMPKTDAAFDKHLAGDFSDTSLQTVQENVGQADFVEFHPGFIPETFADADLSNIALLHVDLDIRKSILDTLAYCYDRVVPGGFMLFDDYGFESCYGARMAVDDFFSDKPETPLCLPTGQALAIKS